MSEQKIKGGVLKGYMKFIRYQWGADGLAECEGQTGMRLNEIQEEKFYSLEHNEAILKWVHNQKGMEYLTRMGNYTVKNLGVLSHVVRFANIKFLLRKAKENYKDTFNYGSCSVLTDEKSKRATIIFKDTNIIYESCVVWQGALEGMLEITRTKGNVSQAKCQPHGDEYCEYVMKWE